MTTRVTICRRAPGRVAGFAVIMCAVLATAGCSKEYQRQSGDQSAQREQVRRMVQELRQGGADKLDQTLSGQCAAELDAAQKQALSASMKEVVVAETESTGPP